MDTRVVLEGEIGVDDRRSQKKIAKQLKKIPGVVDVFLETGEVRIIAMGDAATLKAQIEDKLGRPVKVVLNLAATPPPPPPPPPVGGGYGVMPHSSAAPLYAPAVGGGYAMRPPSAVPFFTHPAPPLGPYAGYPQPRYAAPPPQAGYYYIPTHAPPAGTFKDEFDHGRCGCSIL